MCRTAGSEQASRCQGTQALTIIGNQLADMDYDVTSPEWVGTHLLKVTNAPLALCELTLRDDRVHWYYQPFWGHQGTARDIAAMVAAILGPGNPVPETAPSAGHSVPPCHPQLAEVATALVELGLLVACSDVSGDGGLVQLAVDNPARRDRGTVQITSDHAVIWDCRFASSSGGDTSVDFAGIADTIARAVDAASCQPVAVGIR